MNRKRSYMEKDNLRQEIAVLQEDIQAFIPAYGKFKIPSIQDNSSGLSSGGEDADILEYYVPYFLTFAWGHEMVPKGTRFIVSFIGANISDGRITGIYDRNEGQPNPSHKLAQYIIELIMLKAREQAIFDYCYDNDTRIACHHARSPRDGDVGDMVPNNYPDLEYTLWEGPLIDTEKTLYQQGIHIC